MKDLQEQYGYTYLFISHDLSVVEYISDTIGVMYLGSMMEMGDKSVYSKILCILIQSFIVGCTYIRS